MNSKEIIYNIALAEVVNLHLDDYHTLFLAQMVLRKIRHPEEKMDEISFKVMRKMSKLYKKKKDVLELSAEKSLDNLEEKLEDCQAIPECLYAGKTVSNVVKYLVQKVLDILEEEEQ